MSVSRGNKRPPEQVPGDTPAPGSPPVARLGQPGCETRDQPSPHRDSQPGKLHYYATRAPRPAGAAATVSAQGHGSSSPGPGRWMPWAFGSLLSLPSSFSTMSLLLSSFASSLPLCCLSFSLFFSSPFLFHPALLSPFPLPFPHVSHLPPVFLFPPLSNSPLVEDLPRSAHGLPDQLLMHQASRQTHTHVSESST